MKLNIPPTLSQIRGQGALTFIADGSAFASSSKTQAYADASAGNLFANVPTGKSIKAHVNSTPSLSIGAAWGTQADIAWCIGRYGAGSTDNTAAGIGSNSASHIYHNVVSTGYHHFQCGGLEKARVGPSMVEADRLSLGGAFGSSADPSSGGLALTNRVQFAGAGTASSVLTTEWADASAGNKFANVPTGKYSQSRVAGAGLLSLGRYQATQGDKYWAIGAWSSNGAAVSSDAGFFSANGSIYANVPTGANYDYYWNGVNKIKFSSTMIEGDRLSLGGTIGSSTDPGAGGLITVGSQIVGTAANATNATGPFPYIPSCAGTPTGVPTAFTGRVPLVIDSTNSKLYAYIGGAWKSVTLA